MQALSQRDPRWGNLKINGTNYTLATDGCLITCLAMVAGTTPDIVLNKIGFTGAQVNWTGLENLGLQLVAKENTYANDYVKDFITAHGSCVVRTDFDGNPNSNDTHFVLFIGNGRMLDPWTGTEEATSKYNLVTGFRAVRKVGPMANTMTVDIPTWERIRNNSEKGDYLCSLIGLEGDISKYEKAQLLEKVTPLIKAVDEAKAAKEKLGELEGLVLELKKQVEAYKPIPVTKMSLLKLLEQAEVEVVIK